MVKLFTKSKPYLALIILLTANSTHLAHGLTCENATENGESSDRFSIEYGRTGILASMRSGLRYDKAARIVRLIGRDAALVLGYTLTNSAVSIPSPKKYNELIGALNADRLFKTENGDSGLSFFSHRNLKTTGSSLLGPKKPVTFQPDSNWKNKKSFLKKLAFEGVVLIPEDHKKQVKIMSIYPILNLLPIELIRNMRIYAIIPFMFEEMVREKVKPQYKELFDSIVSELFEIVFEEIETGFSKLNKFKLFDTTRKYRFKIMMIPDYENRISIENLSKGLFESWGTDGILPIGYFYDELWSKRILPRIPETIDIEFLKLMKDLGKFFVSQLVAKNPEFKEGMLVGETSTLIDISVSKTPTRLNANDIEETLQRAGRRVLKARN